MEANFSQQRCKIFNKKARCTFYIGQDPQKNYTLTSWFLSLCFTVVDLNILKRMEIRFCERVEPHIL